MILNPSEEDRQTAKRLEAETREAMRQWGLAAEAVDQYRDETTKSPQRLEELLAVCTAREAEYRDIERIRTRHEARTGVRVREQYEALQRASKGRIVMYRGRSFGVIRGKSRPTLHMAHFEERDGALEVVFTSCGRLEVVSEGWRTKYGDLWVLVTP